MGKYKNIFGTKINVCGIGREPNEIFDQVDDKSQEMKNLLAYKYIEKVKEEVVQDAPAKAEA